MIDGRDGLSPDNPFFLDVPLIEKSSLQRNVTKGQCVNYATKISYRMCQQLYEALNTKHAQAIEAMNTAHSAALEALATELRAEMAHGRVSLPSLP